MYVDGLDTIGMEDYRYVSEDGKHIVEDDGQPIYGVKELFSSWKEIYALRGDENSMKELADKIAGTLLKDITAFVNGKPLTKEELAVLIQNAIL